jgi:hypothetical protein
MNNSEAKLRGRMLLNDASGGSPHGFNRENVKTL